ncbi:MAG: alpha/beta fold hydrolase [Rhodospirillaceae bacterium]|jgi:3-oxoadipate enol-lactonase|nr:alpha/beta fold hydrolase [Rhodospirillaceae bacterium]MBT5242806.1 alpha/beta fold hydrolase [Rhodospirillaceae bacterium]MBT5564007.1 alpha/beta fold hydrolase [Rhodospirillaceae bacterium]MBT6243282.1 alpha/beta fold hydrolase [Rhodospirillaceae bacterium]MBT7136986.1 alpha/beta fold hydrolase [Rhodospirillaceae bacterium]
MFDNLIHPKTAVLIHGLCDDRSVWDRQVPAFRDSMNVITYDIRGFGASPVGAANGTVDQMADDLAQIVSAAGAGPVWLVGFSMGGVISQRFALDFPDMVAGLVLVASSCVVGRPGVEYFESRIAQVEKGGLDVFRSIAMEDGRGCIGNGDEALISEYQNIRINAVRDPEGYLNAGRAMLRLSTEPIIQDLGKINKPTLVIAGDKDIYCPPKASQMIADAIPGSELEIISGAGHCMHWEETETTNNLVSRFILDH